MEKNKIEKVTSRAAGYISRGRLRDAIAVLRELSEKGMQWEISDGLDRIEKNYAYMLRYLTDGVKDPDRDKIYADLVCEILMASDMLARRLMMPDCATLYFNTLRIVRTRCTSLPQLLSDYTGLYADDNNIAARLAQGQKISMDADKKEMERVERDIFNYIWTMYPVREPETDALRSMLSDAAMPLRTKHLAVSALVLGAMEIFDSGRLLLLMDIYGDSDADMSLTSSALAGILLALFRFHDRPLPVNVQNRLKLLSDTPHWQSDLKTAFLELIRTRDTERINRTMREDIIPGMMKMRPDIINKINDGTLDPDNMEANPEWEKMLEDSGLAERIRDLSELQQEGADVFMSTFSHLKSFPFFNEAANWFMPFDTEHTDVAATGLPSTLTRLIAAMPMLCDSDKYSFFLSLDAVPESQRKMMLSQFEAQNSAHLEEMMKAEASIHPNRRRATLSAFLQNLYRFLNLFRRKGEFYNPFPDGVNLLKVEALTPYFRDFETVQVVAEFFFRYGYWEDALFSFNHLDSISEPQGQIFQKIGYCHQKLGELDKAIEYYHQAELFDPESVWLMRRLASAYRMKGDFLTAAGFYKRLADKEPENIDLTLTLGVVLMQAGDYTAALTNFYKAEFLDGNSIRPLRPLAWTLFLTGDYRRARKYYERIMEDKPTPTDYLNMGHVAMALEEYKEAINFYKLSMTAASEDSEALIRNIRADSVALGSAGVTDSTVALIIDALLYSLR
ncbi:MAG: tetratricopeptide repeat protein [Bacteroidales bacterium]|nr:tetratricopeptide repeat protein [Bacteroidales bacterium]